MDSLKSINLNVIKESIDKIYLIGFGDFHFGAVECNLDAIEKQIKWIKDTPQARVILMGDLLNCGTKLSIGGGAFDDKFNPQEQLEKLEELLLPIKNKIYGIHMGNHEQRIWNETGINVSKILAKILGVKYLGYSAHTLINVKGINYRIFSTHGASNASLPYTKIKNCLDLVSFIDADVYMMGHVHALQVQTQDVKRINLKNKTIDNDKKYFVLTGHYLNYENSYAEMKNMRPSKQGCVKIRLDSERKDVHVSI